MPPFSRLQQAFFFCLALAVTVGPAAAQRVGINSAVNPDANGTPPGEATHQLVIGQAVVHNEHIVTSALGQSQILFLDGSAMTVAPNSDLTVDDFVYDPKSDKGQMAVTVTTGVFRYVGGKLSKDNPVTFYTPQGSLSIRGGAFVFEVKNGKLEAALLYGKGLTITANCAGSTQCSSQTITRPGFAVSVSSPGAAPSSPSAAPADFISSTLAQFNGPAAGANGGLTTAPTDATIANSGVSKVISGNVSASVQQAAVNNPTPTTTFSPPTTATSEPSSVQSNIASTSVQGDPTIVQSAENPTPPGTPINPPSQPQAPQPVVVSISGAYTSTNSPPTVAGFNDPSNSGVYSGTITYPAGSTLQNGIVSGTAETGTSGTLSPLTPGQTTAVTFQGGNGEVLTGTATMTPDGDFFYANLSGNSPGAGGPIRAFIMGGAPVSQSFYAPTASPQYLTFQVQPDAALANGAQAQTIPFLPSYAGGTMPNAVVSPFYVVAPANQQFGAYNPATNPSNSNPTLIAPKWLQASLAVNGQGSAQTAALVVGMGSFSTSNDNNQVIVNGDIRGMVSLNATSPYTEIFASAHSVPDASGNSLFGGSTLSGFVLDQNSDLLNNTSAPALATVNQFGQSSTNYAFNQPVTATGTFTPGAQSALNETGYFGGIMMHSTSPATGSVYALGGTTLVQTDPATNRLAATFTGADPFTGGTGAGKSGINSMVLQFGSLPTTDTRNYNRSIYIDNNTYAADESPVTPSQINGVNLPTLTTVANPNSYAPGSSPPGGTNLSPSLTMVTASALGPNANSWMPAGVTPCTCEYLQWGYWTGQLVTPNAGLTASTRTDRAYINTWLAGQPTVTMPTSGTGNFNGAAVGTVSNNGAVYLAAGQFNNTWNFGTNTGTVTISNFDGNNFATGPIHAVGNTYTGALTGGRFGGTANGQFFGPNAVETGGNFFLHQTTGTPYLASGIFAGK
jgi:trimeric autotransporter adhesin